MVLPVNRFTYKLSPKVPHNIPRNPPFCSFASCLINKSDSSSDLIIFLISFISLLEIITSDYAKLSPKGDQTQTFSNEYLHLFPMILLLILMVLKCF